MKVGCLFSGGKDSAYSLFLIQKKHEVKCLIYINSKNLDSHMFHVSNLSLIKEQAKALALPLIITNTKGEKEKELEDLKIAIKKAKEKYNIEGIVSGAIESNYQKSRIENICKELNLESITPLWHINHDKYLQDLIKNKFEVIIIKVAADGLDNSYLNRKLDKKCLEDLKKVREKHRISLVGEGGEIETFVISAPNFKKRINLN